MLLACGVHFPLFTLWSASDGRKQDVRLGAFLLSTLSPRWPGRRIRHSWPLGLHRVMAFHPNSLSLDTHPRRVITAYPIPVRSFSQWQANSGTPPPPRVDPMLLNARPPLSPLWRLPLERPKFPSYSAETPAPYDLLAPLCCPYPYPLPTGLGPPLRLSPSMSRGEDEGEGSSAPCPLATLTRGRSAPCPFTPPPPELQTHFQHRLKQTPAHLHLD